MVRGSRPGEVFPVRQRLPRGHYSALPYDDLPAFVADLRDKEAILKALHKFPRNNHEFPRNAHGNWSGQK